MAAFAITQAFAGLTLRGSSAGNVATSKPIAAKAHFGGVRALGKTAFAQRAKAQRLQVRAEAEADGASEANAATQATMDEGDAPRPRGEYPRPTLRRDADFLHGASVWTCRPFFLGDAVTSRPRDARCDRRDPPRKRAMARPRRPRIVRSRLDRIAPREDRPARPSPAAAFSWFRALVDPVWIRRAPHWQHGQEKADEKNPRKTQPLADLPRPPIPSVQQLAVAVAVAVAVAAGPRATVSPRTSSRCSA